MEQIIIKRDGENDLSFHGELLAEVKDTIKTIQSRQDISYRLYRNQAKGYICEFAQETTSAKDKASELSINRHTFCAVCNKESEVVKFFGIRSLARKLYDQCSINIK